MAEVLTYPLTPVPLALSHVDGTMLSTEKSVFLKHLESKIVSTPPASTHETIIDASFSLYLQSHLPSTFGKVARVLLGKTMAEGGNVIHYVVDKWIEPSIKDSERDTRNSTRASYQINGSEQKRPTNWHDALKNPNFKIALNQYLVKAWNDNSLAEIFGEKVIYANCGDVCYKYSVDGDTVICQEEPRLFSTHEEADSRMFFHVAFSSRNRSIDDPHNIVVRTNDTDCLVI